MIGVQPYFLDPKTCRLCHHGEPIPRVFVRVLCKHGFALCKLEHGAANMHSLFLQAVEIHFDPTGVVGLLLLHVRFHDSVTPAAMRGALSSYRNRYVALQDAVMETEPTFREEVLGEVRVATLLTDPIYDLVGHWQTSVRQTEEARQ